MNKSPWGTWNPLLYVLLTVIIVGFILLFACVSLCKKRKSSKPDTVPVLSSYAVSRASRMSTLNKLTGGGFTSPDLYHQLMQTSKGNNLPTLEQLLTGQVPQASRAYSRAYSRANSRASPNLRRSPRTSALSALEKIGNSLVSPLKKLKKGRKRRKRRKQKRRKRHASASD